MTHYTDFLDNPICEGDEIIYAQSAYGGGAQLHRAHIVKLVPLVPHRNGRSGVYMRADQANHRDPTRFDDDTLYSDPRKRFVIQVMRKRHAGFERDENGTLRARYREQKYTIPHSQHIVRVG